VKVARSGSDKSKRRGGAVDWERTGEKERYKKGKEERSRKKVYKRDEPYEYVNIRQLE